MKKISIASASVALALAIMPLAAFAEENTTETKPAAETTTTAPETDQNTDATNVEKPAGEDTNTQPATTNPEQSKQEQPKQEEPKQPIEECTSEPTDEDFHDIIITDIKDLGNNQVKVTAKLDGKTAKGTWYIAAGKEDAEAPAVEEELKRDGVNFTYVLDTTKLEAGENVVFVAFEGMIDGKDCQFGYGFDLLLVEKEGNNDDSTVKPNPDKPDAKPTPEQGKDGVEKIKGGKLPKTATSYPMGAVAGLALLVGGTVLMVRSRRAAE